MESKSEEVQLRISGIIVQLRYNKKYFVEPRYLDLNRDVRSCTRSIAALTVIINERESVRRDSDGDYICEPTHKTILLISEIPFLGDLQWVEMRCRDMYYLIVPDDFVKYIRENMAYSGDYDKLLLTERRFGGNGKVVYSNVTEYENQTEEYMSLYEVNPTVYFDAGSSISRVNFFPGFPKCKQFCIDDTKSVSFDLRTDFAWIFNQPDNHEYIVIN